MAGFQTITFGRFWAIPEEWGDEPPLWLGGWGMYSQSPVQANYTNFWTPAAILNPPDTQSFNITDLTPSLRVPFVANSGPARDDCDASWQFSQAVALACLLSTEVDGNVTATITEPPTLSSESDLTALSVWLRQQLTQDGLALSRAYTRHVPAQVIASATNSAGALSSIGGSSGTHIAEAANALISIYTEWQTVQTDALRISDAMDSARNEIALETVAADQSSISLSIQQLQEYKAIGDDVAQAAGGIGEMISGFKDPGKVLSGATAAAAGANGLVQDLQTLPLIAKLQNDNMKEQADKILAALTNLHDVVVSETQDIATAMATLRQQANTLQSDVQSYATDGAAASYYAGKAAGLDVWNCKGSDGQALECVSHVNTVLNRRYAGYQIRYQAALKQAKALGYIARRAIEQRIGVRLSDITTPVGPLDPPSTWADDVCSVQGINFQALNQEFPDAGTPAQQSQIDNILASQYANAFIGDWVNKLSNFVNYYNVAFPEQSGNDTAVLSLRENLLQGSASCEAPSRNLVIDSSRLFVTRDGSSSTLPAPSGWVLDECGGADATCLQVVNSPVTSNQPGPSGTGVGAFSVSWLSDQARPAAVNGTDVANSRSLPNSPDGFVSQQVNLQQTGTYVLSWWDQGRDPTTGAPTATPQPQYHVTVYDSSWTPVAGFAQAPAVATTPATWSGRQSLTFQVRSPDVFHVAFGASGPAGPPGSVAIADVQLEVAGAGGLPSPYVDTGDSGQVSSISCSMSSSQLLSAFQHNCDSSGTCYYELKTPITLDTQTMSSNGRSLAGKLAVGNYNFRHVDVALNVVGTGVINCGSGSPDCFGSAYLDYTLADMGGAVGVLGYDGQYRSFDFGTATMDHAKAMTAERYLTLPLSSSDQGLVSQVLQTQFRGRPLDGSYLLRIYDAPNLNWSNIQDIQVLLNYHYWSRIVTAGTSP